MYGTKLGIGTDIESVKRFKNLCLTKDNHFLNKIFTNAELDYCFSDNLAPLHLAARYAGKESVLKALNSINVYNISYKEIEILNNEIGVPNVKIHNKNMKLLDINISLSHTKEIALAFCIIGGLNHAKQSKPL
jgi:holo-[acyl-carrier protein] synthase